MTFKVCVSIPPKTIDEAIDLIQKAEAQAIDIIEVRLDSLKNHDHISDIPKYSKKPLIATNKSTEYHGRFSGTEAERQKILLNAARNGFEYVDVDLGMPCEKELVRNLKEVGTKVIVSFHDFEKTPPITELNRILVEELASGADICKIITTARTVEDNLVTLNFISEATKNAQVVCFAMGELGKPSRLLSGVFGGFFTFASFDEKRKTAEGQLTIQEMARAYESLRLNKNGDLRNY